MRDKSTNTILLLPEVEIKDEDIIVTVASDEEKIAAVLYCLANCIEGHTIRTIRKCAAEYTPTPIGERTVRRIVRVLAYELSLVRYDTKLRKWVPSPSMPRFHNFQHALEFVITNSIRFR